MSVGFENKEFTLEANVSERDKVSGRAISKRISFASSKVAALGPMYTSCVAILSDRVVGT